MEGHDLGVERRTALSLSKGIMQSSKSGTVRAAGRPAPEVGNVAVATVAESSTQPTTRSTIREKVTGDQSNNERQKVLTSRPDRHGNNANVGTCRAFVLTADPEDILDTCSIYRR